MWSAPSCAQIDERPAGKPSFALFVIRNFSRCARRRCVVLRRLLSLGSIRGIQSERRPLAQPNCFLHFLSVEFFTKSGPPRLRQVYKRATRRNEMLQFGKQLAPGGRNKSVTRSCHIHQVVSVVVADDQRVKTARSGEIAADYELLSTIHAILDPG